MKATLFIVAKTAATLPRRVYKRLDLGATLLAIETLITAIPFVVSWFLCAIALAIKEGWTMAKADTADKAIVMNKLWKREEKPNKGKP